MVGAMGTRVAMHAGRQEMRGHRDCPKNTGEQRESTGVERWTRGEVAGERIE